LACAFARAGFFLAGFDFPFGINKPVVIPADAGIQKFLGPRFREDDKTK
jgi:hypothetical protein